MSYEGGITRLYIVAAAIWVIWGLYRPIARSKQSTTELAMELLKSADAQLGDCYRRKGEAEMAGHGTLDAGDKCNSVYQKETDAAYRMLNRNRSPLEIYRDNIGSVAAGCLLPPAGGAILLFSLFWVARGFRRSVATGG